MFAVHHTTWLVAALWAAAGAIAQGQALWLEQTERPSPDARDAIALLQGAAAEGLDARDYPVPPPDSPEFDDALASSTLRYLHDLRFGRVDPRALGFDVPSRDNVDLALLLRDAAGDHRIRGLAMELS